MPYRKIPIAKGEIYHVFNRSVAKQPIFISNKNYQRAIETIQYYQYGQLPIRFSFYNRLAYEQKVKFNQELKEKYKPVVDILSYCLMPNHIHFLLKNLTNNGIIQFMSNFQNSYAKFFNLKNERTGTLFQPMFKAVRIESDEQLVHVSRYIHLNPVTAYLTNIDQLTNYQWSSYPYFINQQPSFVNKEFILNLFKSLESYRQFVKDQADYQRKLAEIRHLILE